MQVQLETLVFWILVAVTLAGLMTVGFAVYGLTAESADISCLSSVGLRAFSGQIANSVQTDLRCATRIKEHDEGESDKSVREDILKDATWCYHAFGGGKELSVIRQEDTFCHVCAIHFREGGQPIPGLHEEVNKRFKDQLGLGEYAEPDDEWLAELQQYEPAVQSPYDVEIVFPTEKPVGIIFVQAKEDAPNLLLQLTDDIDWGAVVNKALFAMDILDYTIIGATIVTTGGTGTLSYVALKKATVTGVRRFLKSKSKTVLIRTQGRRIATAVGDNVLRYWVDEIATVYRTFSKRATDDVFGALGETGTLANHLSRNLRASEIGTIKSRVASQLGSDLSDETMQELVEREVRRMYAEKGIDTIPESAIQGAVRNNLDDVRLDRDATLARIRANARQRGDEAGEQYVDYMMQEVDKPIRSTRFEKTGSGATTSVIGTSIFIGTAMMQEDTVANGIVIRPYDEELIEQLGCTTIDPSPE